MLKKAGYRPYNKVVYTSKNAITGKTYTMIYLRCCDKFCSVLRRAMYKPTKTITRKLLNRLDATGIAIWYMDDGSLTFKKRSDGSVRGLDLKLHTCFLNEAGANMCILYFKEVWGITFRLLCEHHRYYSLRCGTLEAMRFIDIIKPTVSQIPSMHYKIQYKFTCGGTKQKVSLCSDDDITKREREVSKTKKLNPRYSLISRESES